jgi:hypothetical protein
MTTGALDGTSPDSLAAQTQRLVEIVGAYPNGAALRMGHQGVPEPDYEREAVGSGLLDRVEVSEAGAIPTIYALVITGAGKKIVESMGDPKDRITVTDARRRVEESFGNE